MISQIGFTILCFIGAAKICYALFDFTFILFEKLQIENPFILVGKWLKIEI